MNTIFFLFKKTIKNKFNIFPILLFIICISIFLFGNNQAIKTLNLKTEITQNLSSANSQIEQTKQQLKSTDVTSNMYSALQQTLSDTTLAAERYRTSLAALKNNDWRLAYPPIIAQLTDDLKVMQNPKSQTPNDLKENVSHNLLMIKALYTRNLPFEDPDYPIKAMTFTVSMLQIVFPIAFPLVIVYILSLLFSGLYRDRLNLELLSPKSKLGSTFLSLSTGVGLSTILCFTFIIFTFVISFIFFGAGSLRFPILTYSFLNQGMYFQDISNVIVPSLILLFLEIIFITIVTYLFAYIFRERMVSFFTSLLIITGFTFLPNFIEPMQKIAVYLPTTYINGVSVVTGQYANSLNNFSISFGSGLTSLTVSIAIMLIILWFTQENIKKN